MVDSFSQSRENVMSKAYKNKKILIVDDERMFAFLLARLLRSRGYGASFVYSAEKALDRISNERYDLVIADIRMDGMSGYEMIKYLRNQYGANCPRFLVGTGTQFTLDQEEMKALNIYKILEKPFPRPSRLFREIEEAINHEDH
jgi:CheY-like chemotaxis protein